MKRKYFPQSAIHRGAACAFFLILSGTLAGIVPAGHGQAATAPAATHEKEYAQAEQNARKIANEWLARGIPGVTLAVAVDGKIVYAEGFGYADMEQRVPVWPGTKFRIASDSKPLTAVGLMLLVEQGKIDLDAPVQKYVPSFPDKSPNGGAKMWDPLESTCRHASLSIL